MLRSIVISLITLRVMLSEDQCSTDNQCAGLVGFGSECKQVKVGDDCQQEYRCTNPDKIKDYQSCECSKLNGKCMDMAGMSEAQIGASCPEVGLTQCPKNPNASEWKCCISGN